MKTPRSLLRRPADLSRRQSLGLFAGAAVSPFVLSPFALSSGARAENAVIKVVTTTSMIADAARQVGGDRVEVAALMGPGVDPHAYRQTRTDILALSRADVVLWHGLYLEAQMEEFLLGLAQKRPVVAVGESVAVEKRLGNDDYADRFDPHVWMDPALWRDVVTAVRDALIEAAPNDQALFEANTTRHLAEIDNLAVYASNVLASVPERSRVLLSAHDAFNYFGSAYGYDVEGIQGISTEAEAGLRRIEELVALIVERDVKAVFIESSVSDRNVRALIEGAGAQGHDLSIGGELFSDAMGPAGSYEGTYIGMIDHNATTIARALGGEAPELGMRGALTLATSTGQ